MRCDMPIIGVNRIKDAIEERGDNFKNVYKLKQK